MNTQESQSHNSNKLYSQAPNANKFEQFDIEDAHASQKSSVSHLKAEQGASVYNATINICKSGFGTTILFMPYVFMKCGSILSIILMTFTGALCYYAWMQLIKVIQKIEEQENYKRSITLKQAVETILGDRMVKVVEFFTVFFNFGTILSYMVFIQKSMDDILKYKLILCVIMACIFIPISLYRNIQKLGIFSQFGLTTFFVAVLIIIIKSLYLLFSGNTSSNDPNFQYNLFSFNEIPLFFGVYVFAYDINGVVTEVYASMEERSKFDIILYRYVIVMCLTGLITGAIGYAAFKDTTSDLIFNNLADMGSIQQILKIFYAISLLGSILLYGFPILQRIDTFMERRYFTHQNFQRTGVRLLFFLLIFVLATQLPKLTDLFNLLGCVFSIGLGFVFPIMLSEKISGADKDHRRRVVNYTVLFIGLFGGLSGVVSTLIEIF
ncbi:hypothetical protein ABPG74_004760 [Tetrahymena malaccensis]